SAHVGVAGVGDGLRRRLSMLANADINPKIFEGRSPSLEELADLHLLFVAGWDRDESAALAAQARMLGVLVNVEDVPDLCDFHVPAAVRRGDLLMTVSTGGRAPGLSRALRMELEQRFGPEWNRRLDEIAQERGVWRGEGAAPAEVSDRTRAYLAGK